MCGIAGFIRKDRTESENISLLSRMGDSLYHRGPDAGGNYLGKGVGMAHRRLSILDLSDSGAQPMTSHSGRYVMVYNGEIYNYMSLRKELKGENVHFRGNSDSEVFLAMFERDGPDCLSRLNGMFAVAIWDTETDKLFLARDRLGKKPLYYYKRNGQFLFGSEIKAILCATNVDTSLRTDAVADFFYYQYIPDPKSIYAHVHKLEPGYWMTVDRTEVKKHQYWNVSFAQVNDASESDLQEELFDLLEDAVKIRMVSDVPLGAFLSGGIDSSAIVSTMARVSKAKPNTCSIGFNSKQFDEVDQARNLADYLGAQHNEFTVSENIADKLVEVASWFDEPFADPSFLPTYYVSQLARQKVTVALSGDGGDENFAGYGKYLVDQTENRIRGIVPSGIRKHVFPPVSAMLVDSGVPMLCRAASLLGSLSVAPDAGFAISNSFFRQSLWNSSVSNELKRECAHYHPSELTLSLYNQADTDDHLSKLLYTDLKSYLPGDILVKVDRMSMANSLETRAPLLDYRIVEFAASLPSDHKIKNGRSKYLLKQCASRILPPEVMTRPKKGFSVPLAKWLRHDLKDLAGGYLFSRTSGISEYFEPSAIERIWQAHQSARMDYSSELWSLLVFELWWQRTQVVSQVHAA